MTRLHSYHCDRAVTMSDSTGYQRGSQSFWIPAVRSVLYFHVLFGDGWLWSETVTIGYLMQENAVNRVKKGSNVVLSICTRARARTHIHTHTHTHTYFSVCACASVRVRVCLCMFGVFGANFRSNFSFQATKQHLCFV